MRPITKAVIYPLLCAFLLLSMTSVAFADLEAVKKACVSIKAAYGTGENAMISSGSGFIVSTDGFIVTNAHVVVSNDIAVDVKIGDRTHTVKGTLYYHDELLDIAILKVQLGGLGYLELGDDTELKLGQRLFAVGSPLVFTDIFTDGIFSSYNEQFQMIQHTAALSHGNSGGPLVTEEGMVMGVNTVVVAFPGESRYFFAIPSSIVKAVLDGIQGQATLTELKITPPSTAPAPSPAPAPPSTPAPVPGSLAPAPSVSDVSVTPDYLDEVIGFYPQGWMNYAASYFHYSFDLPDFYSYQFSSDETFILDGLEFFGSYDNFDDPNFAAVPIVMLYIGSQDAETFHEFKQRIWTLFQSEGFTMDTSFEMEDIDTSMPGLEFDAYWFDGNPGSDYSTLSRAVYFIRDKYVDDVYYCLDFTFNGTMGDALDTITFPLMIQIIWTFITTS